MTASPNLALDAEQRAPVPGAELLHRFRNLEVLDKLALIGFLAVFAISFLGPYLAPHSPTIPVGGPFGHPSHAFPMGTDDIGDDIWSRVLWGARQSWIGALIVIASGVVIGTLVGLAAGAVGGWLDMILMRITDAFLALPGPVLALAVAAALGRSFGNTLIAVGIVWWPLYARIVRGEVKALSSRPHIEAATLAGTRRHRLWLRHLLPGAVPPILVAASLDVGGLILTIAGLSFLGLGSPQPAPELGSMTAQGLPYLLTSPWVALFPALVIFVIALSSNLAGDAVRGLLEE